MIDSGASFSCVNHNFVKMVLKQRNVETFDTNIVVTLGNSSQLHINKIALLKIQIGPMTWTSDFCIVENLPQDVIIGLDFIKWTTMVLDPSSDSFTFKFDPSTVHDLLAAHQIKHLFSHINNEISTSTLIQNLISKFPEVLTKELGITDKIKCDLKLKPGSTLKTTRVVYTQGPVRQQAMKSIIDDLLAKGVIEPIYTDTASPCFLVPKQNSNSADSWRLVTDYRELNSKLEFLQYPVPSIESAFMHLKRAKYFSVLDLNSAYNQIALTKRSMKLTAFQCEFGTFAYKRLPFGVNKGGQILSKLMDKLFADIRYKYCFYYFDDVFIYSNTLEEHIRHLEDVLTRLQKAGLTVNPDKIKLAQQKIDFLGNQISQGQITINPDRVSALLQIPRPRTPKEVASFLGSVNFFARFLPNFQILAKPLNALRRKTSNMVWGDEAENTWQKLRKLITEPPVLATPDFAKRFQVYTDGSKNGVAAILAQEHDGILKPIAFASKQTNSRQENYSPYELEALAIQFAFKKYRVYLEHQEFDLFTDHKALTAITNLAKNGGNWLAGSQILCLSDIRYTT
uniref:RNA-directed DNA polymerase n=1 Tax=Lygus hesperus TaxID=30085 RepID=A0A0A9Z9D6_LYGHE